MAITALVVAVAVIIITIMVQISQWTIMDYQIIALDSCVIYIKINYKKCFLPNNDMEHFGLLFFFIVKLYIS